MNFEALRSNRTCLTKKTRRLRDAPQEQKRENVEIFPPVWEPHICEKIYGLFCILGPEEHLLLGISHVKNSKKWKWDSGRPTPVFQNFHIFLFKPACSNLLTAAKYRLHLRVIYAALVWAVTTIKVQRKPDHAGNGFGLRLLLQDSSNWSDTESSKLTFHTFQIFKPMRNKRKFSWNLKVLYFLITRCQKDASNRILLTTAQLLK